MRYIVAALLFTIVAFQVKSQKAWRGTYRFRDAYNNTATLIISDSAKLNSFRLEVPQDSITRIIAGHCKQIGDTLELWATRTYNAPDNAVDKHKYLVRLAYIGGQLKTDCGQMMLANAPTRWMTGFAMLNNGNQ